MLAGVGAWMGTGRCGRWRGHAGCAGRQRIFMVGAVRDGFRGQVLVVVGVEGAV